MTTTALDLGSTTLFVIDDDEATNPMRIDIFEQADDAGYAFVVIGNAANLGEYATVNALRKVTRDVSGSGTMHVHDSLDGQTNGVGWNWELA